MFFALSLLFSPLDLGAFMQHTITEALWSIQLWCRWLSMLQLY